MLAAPKSCKNVHRTLSTHDFPSTKVTNFHIDNFKSLVDFDLPMAKLTCLIGLNGSGKSTGKTGTDHSFSVFGWLETVVCLRFPLKGF